MKEREVRRNTDTAEVVSDSASGDGQACLVDAGVQTRLTSKSIDECGLLSRKDLPRLTG